MRYNTVFSNMSFSRVETVLSSCAVRWLCDSSISFGFFDVSGMHHKTESPFLPFIFLSFIEKPDGSRYNDSHYEPIVAAYGSSKCFPDPIWKMMNKESAEKEVSA